MRPANNLITLTGQEAIEVLKEVELILISLHKIGSYYMGENIEEYQKETTRFIDEWQVTRKLAHIRKILSEKFDSTLGGDDMDDLERAMQDINYWTPTKDSRKTNP
jgi:hypothetical protein